MRKILKEIDDGLDELSYYSDWIKYRSSWSIIFLGIILTAGGLGFLFLRAWDRLRKHE